MNELTKNQDMLNELMEVNCYLVPEESIDKSKYVKVPVTELSTIGAGISSLAPSLRTVTKEVTVNTEGLYRVTNGVELTQVSGNSNLFRGFQMNTNKRGIAKQAKFAVADPIVEPVTVTMPFNPATMCMAAALMSMDKKLDDILETNKKILSRMVATDKAEIRNNIDFLADIARNYKYNWNNERFLNSNHVIALNIKKDAGVAVKKYRALIQEKLANRTFIAGDISVNKSISEVADDFREYQLSVYLYGYASFIEAILNANFDSEYLNSIVERISEETHEYRQLYKKAYMQLEKKAQSTIENVAIEAINNLGKAITTGVSYVPGLRKVGLDELMEDGTGYLDRLQDKKIMKQLSSLKNKKYPYTRTFIGNINSLNKAYNEPMEVLLDDDSVYFPVLA